MICGFILSYKDKNLNLVVRGINKTTLTPPFSSDSETYRFIISKVDYKNINIRELCIIPFLSDEIKQTKAHLYILENENPIYKIIDTYSVSEQYESFKMFINFAEKNKNKPTSIH